MIERLIRVLELAGTPGAALAAARCRPFSLASFQVVSALRRAGIRPATVIDVGANVGQFAMAVRHLLPGAAIRAIEPDPDVAQRLRRNLGTVADATVFCTAIGDRLGTVTFNVNRDPQVSSILPLGEDRRQIFPTSEVLRQITVPLTTLDALIGADSIEAPVLIKIDVQGYEDRVIAGAARLLQHVDWVILEVAFARLYDGEHTFTALADLLAEHGFGFVRPLNFHRARHTQEVIEMDALFAREPTVARAFERGDLIVSSGAAAAQSADTEEPAGPRRRDAAALIADRRGAGPPTRERSTHDAIGARAAASPAAIGDNRPKRNA